MVTTQRFQRVQDFIHSLPLFLGFLFNLLPLGHAPAIVLGVPVSVDQ
jgi:hypothetical protein